MSRALLVALVLGPLVGACAKTEAAAGSPSAAKPFVAPADARVAGRRATAIGVGLLHSCALGDDGRVFCWGANDHGQLGAATTDSCDVPDLLHGFAPAKFPCREKPAPVDGVADAVELAVAGSTGCARLRDGTVRCWGENAWGIVGDGTTTDRPSAVVVPGLTHVASIAVSMTHACARHDDGTVDCWGLNFNGQLGTNPVQPAPSAVAKLGYGAVKVLSPQKIPGLTDATLLAVGSDITCAKKANDDVVCFGRLAPGTLGQVAPVAMPTLHGVSALYLGQATYCGLFANGTAQCWGASATGPLMPASKHEPKPVLSPVIASAKSLGIGPNRACEVVTPGDVLCWGNGGTSEPAGPRKVTLGTPMTAVAFGSSHACALGVDGSVWCWGDSFYGEAAAPVKGQSAPTSAFWTVVNQASLP